MGNNISKRKPGIHLHGAERPRKIKINLKNPQQFQKEK